MGLSIDERGMPREGDPPNREMYVARVGDKAPRNRQARTAGRGSDKVWILGELCCAPPSIGVRRECTVAHDERRTGMCPAL